MLSYLKKVFFFKSRNEELLNEENIIKCTICLSKIEIPFKTKCNHFFHKECLNDWLKIKKNCPNCRKSIQYLKIERKGLFIRRLRRINIISEPEPELQIEEPNRPPPLYIPPPHFYENEFEENGQLNGQCAECGRNVYNSYNRHPDGHLIYHKRCFQIMFRRNGRQL